MSFCDISFNRKSGVVTDVLNKEGRESALYPQLVSYVQQDPQTVYDSKKEYFDTLIDQGKLVERKAINNLPVLDTENIVSYEGTKGAAQYDKKNNQIKVNRKLLKQKFEEKAWTKPRRLIETLHGSETYSYAQALPENQFKTYNEWEQFVINHEYQHSLYSRNDFNKEFPNKTKGDYESEINKRALIQIEKETTPLFPDELALGLYSIAYNSGVSEQEFMDRINRDGNLSVFGVGGQQVFNQTVPVQQVSVEQERKLKDVAYKHFNVYGYQDYMEMEDRYKKPWKKNYVGEAMMKFGGSDLTSKQLEREKQEVTNRVEEAERKVEQIYRQYLEQGGNPNSLKEFRHYVESEQYVLVDESGMTQTGLDTNLSQKIQNLMQEKYPEIKLDITNAPVWENTLSIFNQREKNKAAYNALVEYYNEQFEEQEEQELMTDVEKQLSKGRLNKLFSLQSEVREEYNEETDEYETVGETKKDIENQKLVDEIYNNYDKAIGRTSTYRGNLRGHILSGNGIVYMPFANDNSALVGFPIDDVFVVSHFAPSSLRMGKELIDNIAKEKMPVVIAVPEYQAAQLEKSGFRFITEIPQYFGGEIVMKKVMVNNATTENDLKNLLDYFQQQKFQTSSNRIIGQANIKAMTVLIDAVNQKQDTLPHEYAHHYIAWFRNTLMVRQAISQWGSEEALVQAIGEQVVAQKGEALNWWKRFVRLILSMFGKVSNKDRENIKNMLTNAFLEGRDLQTGKVGISRERSKELAKKAMEKPPLPQSTEEFISETMKSYNKQNALYAKRLESVLKQHPVGLEQSNYSGPIEYNAAKNTVLVPTVIDNVFDEQVQKEILNQLMVGAFSQAAKEKLKPITAGKINPKTASRPFVFTKIQMESLKQRYGDKVELKNYFDNVIDFVTGYMTDLELSNWADSRFSPKEMAIEKMAELITTEVFEKPILKNAVEEYLKTAPIRMIYSKEVSNTNIDEIVSEIEEYGVIEGDYKESKIKIKENTADVISIVNEIYQTYGEKISDFIFMNESPDGTLTVTVDRKKIAEYQEEIKNQIKENIAANNKYQIEEIEKRKETDMVDAVSYLDYLSDEDKRLAQVFIERGDFPLQCGI